MIRSRNLIYALFCVAVVLLASRPAFARDETTRQINDRDIDRAIARAVRYLYAKQGKDGLWPDPHKQVPDSGSSTWALFALLEAGESHQNENIKRGVEAISKIDTNNLYLRATRVMVLSQIVHANRKSEYRTLLEKDVDWLTKGAARQGAWGYGGPEREGDNSCSQFALLALWEADRAGIEIPIGLVRIVERTWLTRQDRNTGGWQYAGQRNFKGDPTVSMTSAGLASLYICQDVLTRTCGTYRHAKAAESARDFMVKKLKDNYARDGYLAFCVQRVGLATGRKFVGEMDWFAQGASILAKPNPRGHRYRGKYGDVVRAAFELVFLARGRIPLTFNKLRYGDDDQWKLHSRDVPRFTRYMRREYESRMRWQIVGLDDDIQQMLDAPILLVSGVDDPNFTEAQWNKLREYSLRGGTILFVPTHRSQKFFDAVKSRLETLYAPQAKAAGSHYQLQQLDDEHPLYTFRKTIRSGSKVMPVYAVTDGTRILALLTERDVACGWHKQTGRATEIDYEFGVNFYFYATGDNPLSTRLRPVFTSEKRKPVGSVKVAWVKHNGNWNTQPHALAYLSEKLLAENRLTIEEQQGVAIDASKLEGVDLAWMTGSDKVTLSDKQISQMRKYIDSGGTLFVNAVGGARDFSQSARLAIAKILADPNSSVSTRPRQVGESSPLMTGVCGEYRGPRIDDLRRTQAWVGVSGGVVKYPVDVYLHKGRVAVIMADYGIHDTLDGHTAHKARSFMPPSARAIAANVVLYAAMSPQEQVKATEQSDRTTGGDINLDEGKLDDTEDSGDKKDDEKDDEDDQDDIDIDISI